VQIVAALAVALLFVLCCGLPLAVVWIVGLTNAYNFMDGIDGIAGGQAVVAGLAWGWLGTRAGEPALVALGLLIAGSSAGVSPAQLATGAHLHGRRRQCLPRLHLRLAGADRRCGANPKLAVAGALVVWPFVADALFTFLRRAWRRERVMEAHKSHVYQRLTQRGLSHAAVAVD
jgi:UDP-N-acetylmuramyl pentapeptide phosphotransferase/UDP-N-acetylglucosamine-1-phosphate transferase